MAEKKIGPAPAGTEDTVRTHEHYFTIYQISQKKATGRRET